MQMNLTWFLSDVQIKKYGLESINLFSNQNMNSTNKAHTCHGSKVHLSTPVRLKIGHLLN